MRTIEDVIRDYKEAEKDSELAPVEGYERVYGFKNQPLRNKLREEYICLLPLDKRVACRLYKTISTKSDFYYEVNGIEDNWDGYFHHRLLLKARNALEIVKSKTGFSDERCADLVLELAETLVFLS